MIRLDFPSLTPETLSPPRPSFLCPPEHHYFVQAPNESYCVHCGLTRELPPVVTRRVSGFDESVLELMDLPRVNLRALLTSSTDPDFSLAFHRDSEGHSLGTRNQQALRRARFIASHTSGWSRDSASVRSQRLFARLVEVLRVPKEPLDDAARLLRMAIEARIYRSTATEEMVGSSLFATLRSARWKVAVPVHDITDTIGGNEKNVLNLSTLVSRKFRIARWMPQPVDFFRYYESRFNLTGAERRRAVEWLEGPEVSGDFAHGSPTGIVAAVVYLVSVLGAGDRLPPGRKESKRSQHEISTALGISEVCLRSSESFIEKRLREAGKI